MEIGWCLGRCLLQTVHPARSSLYRILNPALYQVRIRFAPKGTLVAQILGTICSALPPCVAWAGSGQTGTGSWLFETCFCNQWMGHRDLWLAAKMRFGILLVAAFFLHVTCELCRGTPPFKRDLHGWGRHSSFTAPFRLLLMVVIGNDWPSHSRPIFIHVGALSGYLWLPPPPSLLEHERNLSGLSNNVSLNGASCLNVFLLPPPPLTTCTFAFGDIRWCLDFSSSLREMVIKCFFVFPESSELGSTFLPKMLTPSFWTHVNLWGWVPTMPLAQKPQQSLWV